MERGPRVGTGPSKVGSACAAWPIPRKAARRPSRSATSQTASPPNPQKWGYTTPIVAPMAIANSIALPPERKTFAPALVASGCGLVTIPS